MRLVPCAPCGRHVYASQTKCPFCDAPLRVGALPSGASRAALYAAALVVGAACGGAKAREENPSWQQGPSHSGPMVIYEDAGPDAPPTRIELCCPPYGCVFPDACAATLA